MRPGSRYRSAERKQSDANRSGLAPVATAATTRAPRRLAIALYLLAVLRVLLVVAPQPMHGYANNYDFIRIASYFDLWPLAPGDEPGFDPLAQHPRAPLRCFHVDPSRQSDLRYPSTDLTFVWLALRLNDGWRALVGSSACELDLRMLGLLRALVLLTAGAAITGAFFRRAPHAGVAAAAILAIVLADPAVTLLLNTLYSDFSTVLLTYVAGALLVYVLGFAAYSTVTGGALGIVLLALAGAKTQYAALPLALASVLALGAGLARAGTPARRARAVALAAAGAVSGAFLQAHALGEGGYMWALRMSTATDTFLGAVLPLHRDPDRALALVGLPARCRPFLGRTWYDTGMQPPPCPEVGEVSRLSIGRLLLDDPALGVRLAQRALPLLRRLIVRDLGQVEGGDRAQADATLRRGIVSVSSVFEELPGTVFTLLACAALLTGLAALADLVGRPARPLLPALVLVCCTVTAYAFVSAVLGDGFVGVARHALPGQLALVVLLGAGPAEIVRLASLWRHDRRA